MKFTKIKMKNFMRYAGENTLLFSCDKEKNVTVVLGDNSVGKTTLAQAFRYGLYGEINIEAGKKRADYQLLNKEVAKEMDIDSIANMYVSISFVCENKHYTIYRDERFKCSGMDYAIKSIYQTLKLTYYSLDCDEDDYKGDVENDTQHVEVEVDVSDINSILNEIIPKDLSDYFLFDGEKWNEANPNSSKKNIRESVHVLTGLSAARQALYHLKGMGSRSVLKQFKGKLTGTGAIYENIQHDIDKLYHLNEDIEEKIAIAKKQEDRHQNKIDEIEKELLDNKSTEQMQKDYKKLEAILSNNERSIERQFHYFIDLFSDKGLYYFAMPLIKNSLKVLANQKIEKRDVPSIRQSTIDYIIKSGKCICGSELTDGSECLAELQRLRDYLPPADIGTLYTAFEKHSQYWDSQQKELAKDLMDDALEINLSINERDNNIAEYNRLSKVMDNDVNFAELRNNLNIAKGNKQSEHDRIIELETKMKANQESIVRKENDLKSLEASTRENQKWNNMIQVTEDLYEVIEKDFKKKEQEVFIRLDQLLKKNFNLLFNAKDKEIYLDNNYNVKLRYKASEDKTDESILSEGEKIARNFAFVLSVLEYSAEEREKSRKIFEAISDEKCTNISHMDVLPMVLDGPFSKLGEENISLIADAMPKIANQVIIFMLKKDWKYTNLDCFVGEKYEITKDAMSVSASIERR